MSRVGQRQGGGAEPALVDVQEGDDGFASKGLFYVPYLGASAEPKLGACRSGTWSPGFATPDWVQLVAGLFDSPDPVCDPSPVGVVRRYRMVLGPGKVRVASTVTGSESPRPAPPRGEVVRWSPRSRLRMVEVMCSLDWGPVVAPAAAGWRPAMVTLTLPGDWLAVAPTGPAFKRLFDAFRRRWDRRWGRVQWVWKLEFQRRGAPHLHIYTAIPPGREFAQWLSRTWFEVVGSGDERHLRAGTGIDWGEGVRASDPKRLAIYFLKRAAGHNLGLSKEYQHDVPEAWQGEGRGPGRFWGYRGLDRCDVQVELVAEQWVQLRRLLRRWAKANRRPVRALGGPHGIGGMVLANDAPTLLAQASRWELLRAAVGGDLHGSSQLSRA